jgi:hypothetical protein
MKRLCIAWVISSCAVLGLIVYSGDSPQAKWLGTIAKKDGILTVMNPKQPCYPGTVLKLTEEIRIGITDGRPEYSFGRISGIAVDGHGCIYVADDKNINIKAFDANGTYLRTIGREGQGPGEIGSPYNVFVSSQGKILVPDGKNLKLHVYSALGEFQQDKSFGSRFPMLTVLGIQNELYVLNFGGDFQTGTYFEFSRLDEDLHPVSVLHKIDIPPGPLRESLSEKIPLFTVRSDGCLAMGFPKTDEYRIRILDPQGRMTMVITRDFERVSIPEDLLDKAKKSLPPGVANDLPTHFAAFLRLMADDEGRIWAQTPPTGPEDKSFTWDVFDPEGRYLTNVRIPGSAWHMNNMKNSIIWKAGKLYTVEEDEDGYHIVKRYRAEWAWK